jgi:spore maturation protein CgeB
LNADIVVTTADLSIGLGAESMNIPHLIYRYSEVLASGALLIAPCVPGIDKYFKQGVHFASFSNVRHAADLIEYYYQSNSERKHSAGCGSQRIQQLIQTQSFWREIDFALGVEGFV